MFMSMFISIKPNSVLIRDFNLGKNFKKGRLQTSSLTKPDTLRTRDEMSGNLRGIGGQSKQRLYH